MPGIHDIPGAMTAQYQLRAHGASTATEQAYCFVAPFDCKIRKVELIWDAAVNGTDTNYTSVALLNTGTDGTGTTALGTQIDYTSAHSAAQGAIETVYAPASYLAVAAGVKLAIKLIKTGTGLALPTGLVIVTFEGD